MVDVAEDGQEAPVMRVVEYAVSVKPDTEGDLKDHLFMFSHRGPAEHFARTMLAMVKAGMGKVSQVEMVRIVMDGSQWTVTAVKLPEEKEEDHEVGNPRPWSS